MVKTIGKRKGEICIVGLDDGWFLSLGKNQEANLGCFGIVFGVTLS